MTGVALVIVATAMIAVRIGWGGPRPLAWGGWIAAAAALAWLAMRDGAWGVATGMVVGTTVALLLVLHAGWTSPAKASAREPRAPREAPSVVLPRRPGDLGRRLLVFLLVVPVGFAAAQWFAFGAQALFRRGGPLDADSVALTFVLQPFVWTLVMTLQMTRAGMAAMIVPPALAAVAGTLLWSAS